MQITWLGHSGFRIEIETAVLLVDPWLTGNPMFPMARRAEATRGATHVLVTHGHGDHIGDAGAIAAELKIPVVGQYDLCGYLQKQHGVQIIGYNRGGTVSLGGARATLVAASHSSSTEGVAVGSECGFMLAGEGHTIYLSGDTDLMADMAWMGEYHRPDIGILSCGGHYTMDMERAAFAARKWFDFRWVIPCHYRTFPLLAQDASALKAGLPPKAQLIEPQVMEPIRL